MSEMKKFSEFNLIPPIMQAVEKLGFKEPTKIQNEVIPFILNGESVIGKSRTGSGKTHAFLFPIMNRLDAEKREVQVVITAPTRELAVQLYGEVQKIIEYANKKNEWTAKLLIGGTDKQRMKEKLKTPPHIVVGTPGRILDMVNEGALSIYSASAFVVDEADLMLDLGFIQDVDQLLVRAKKDIQMVVFSATIPVRLEHFFKKYLENPRHVEVDEHFSPETMEHRLIAKKHREDSEIIWEISKVINPYLAIVFVNGKTEADELANALLRKGLNTGILHGGLTPRERKRVIKDIEQLKYQYIVATDLASRGMDISGVSHVINAQMPKEEAFYIHRVGRTARAGMEGTAISLYKEEDFKLISKLEEKGLTFSFTDIKNGEWLDAKPWNERHLRTKATKKLDQEAWKKVRKPKKVKPGYKKKMKQQQAAIKKQLTKKEKYKK